VRVHIPLGRLCAVAGQDFSNGSDATPAVCFVHEHAFVIGFPDVGRSGDTDRMSQLMREMHTAREADAASRRQVSCCPQVLRAFWTQVSWSLPTL
jgi:hypothetical protein